MRPSIALSRRTVRKPWLGVFRAAHPNRPLVRPVLSTVRATWKEALLLDIMQRREKKNY